MPIARVPLISCGVLGLDPANTAPRPDWTRLDLPIAEWRRSWAGLGTRKSRYLALHRSPGQHHVPGLTAFHMGADFLVDGSFRLVAVVPNPSSGGCLASHTKRAVPTGRWSLTGGRLSDQSSHPPLIIDPREERKQPPRPSRPPRLFLLLLFGRARPRA